MMAVGVASTFELLTALPLPLPRYLLPRDLLLGCCPACPACPSPFLPLPLSFDLPDLDESIFPSASPSAAAVLLPTSWPPMLSLVSTSASPSDTFLSVFGPDGMLQRLFRRRVRSVGNKSTMDASPQSMRAHRRAALNDLGSGPDAVLATAGVLHDCVSMGGSGGRAEI